MHMYIIVLSADTRQHFKELMTMYSTGHKYCNRFSSYFPDKSHFLPYNSCIVYHVEIHQNSSGNVVIFMTGTVSLQLLYNFTHAS